MVELLSQTPRPQAPLASIPYDRWVLPDGYVKAEFHRLADGGYLMRFIDDADFAIYPDQARVIGWPAPECDDSHFRSLFTNAVLPVLGNHQGGLFLHGSAVAIGGAAVAFLGESGDGKTTLAGALAKVGHPFMTEDVIELVASDAGYWLHPKPGGLRLFADSAAWLLGALPAGAQEDSKFDVSVPLTLPFAEAPLPLTHMFLLGKKSQVPLTITPLSTSEAAHRLLPHSFILDVEDKAILRAHFGRIMGLPSKVSCFQLDYIRDYASLPHVVNAIVRVVNGNADNDART